MNLKINSKSEKSILTTSYILSACIIMGPISFACASHVPQKNLASQENMHNISVQELQVKLDKLEKMIPDRLEVNCAEVFRQKDQLIKDIDRLVKQKKLMSNQPYHSKNDNNFSDEPIHDINSKIFAKSYDLHMLQEQYKYIFEREKLIQLLEQIQDEKAQQESEQPGI